MSKKRRWVPPPLPADGGGYSADPIETVDPVYPPGTPPPKTMLGPGPDGTYVVIWRATEAEPLPPRELWGPGPYPWATPPDPGARPRAPEQ